MVLAVVVIALAGAGASYLVRQIRHPPLVTLVHGGSGPPTLVLLHGYGLSAGKWVAFTDTIRLPPRGRFVFPQAPDPTVPPDGPVDGRGWWRLDLGSHLPPGGTIPDLSATRPPGIAAAAARVEDLLAELAWNPGGPLLLGGFSQGAMVAAQVAFLSDTPLAALVLLSGTPVDEATWVHALPRRRGLPVFLAHGRTDPTLSFALAERLRDELLAAGLAVTWYPFDGAHEIPAEVVTALNGFLQHLPLPK